MSASSAALIPTPAQDEAPLLQFPVNGAFDPDPFDTVPGETITLKFTGTSSAQVNVYDSNNDLFDLFKGSTNPYTASGDGTSYQIDDEVPEDTSYTIVYDPGDQPTLGINRVTLVAVRGTINVKKPG